MFPDAGFPDAVFPDAEFPVPEFPDADPRAEKTADMNTTPRRTPGRRTPGSSISGSGSIGRARRTLRARRTAVVVAAIVALFGLATACLPAKPAEGRATPVRRVLVLGDSMSYGLFGTTPQLEPVLRPMLADRGIQLHVTGFPAESPVYTWPGHLGWDLRMLHEVRTFNPDMIVIQSVLFPGAVHPEQHADYRNAVAHLMDVGRSRGAHVYVVKHPVPAGSQWAPGATVAHRLQAEAGASRGVETIPLDWWMQRCAGGRTSDGMHLSAAGQRCHALAITMAVEQLREAVG